jgi:hypothetical protein
VSSKPGTGDPSQLAETITAKVSVCRSGVGSATECWDSILACIRWARCKSERRLRKRQRHKRQGGIEERIPVRRLNANFGPDGPMRPGETAVRTAVPGISLIRMRSQVQVLAGPLVALTSRNAGQLIRCPMGDARVGSRTHTWLPLLVMGQMSVEFGGCVERGDGSVRRGVPRSIFGGVGLGAMSSGCPSALVRTALPW